MLISIAIPSLLTTLIPAASQVSLVAVILLRVAIGFFESSTFPAIYHFYPIWIPGTLGCVCFSPHQFDWTD
jgi:hypothetical protein